jgi:putative ABC transport system permease protein
LFFMLLRKIYKNKWMVLSLLIGLLLCTTMVSSISMFSRTVLHRVLESDLRNFQAEKGKYPGAYVIDKDMSFRTDPLNQDKHRSFLEEFRELDKYLGEELGKEIPLPVLSRRTSLVSKNYVMDKSKVDEGNDLRWIMNLQAISGLEEHVKIIEGRMFSKEVNNEGEYEVIVSESAMEEMNLVLDRPYVIYHLSSGGKPKEIEKYRFNIRVVGVYTYKDEMDTFFGDGGWPYSEYLLMDYGLFKGGFMRDQKMDLNTVRWYYGFDYKKISMDNLEEILSIIASQVKDVKLDLNAAPLFEASHILEGYIGRRYQTQSLLLMFQLPVILLLIIYISMVSHFIVEEDRNEIAVLKSRGVGLFQILPVYLIEGGVIGGIAVLLGPLLGVYMCRAIGASNGFLEFVQRKALVVNITYVEYLYSGIMALVLILAILASVIKAAGKSIVEHKQSRARFVGKPFWMKYYLDVLFMAIVAYGVYSYVAKSSSAEKIKSLSGSAPIEPLLYIVSALFVLGLGMLFLRIYPFIVRLIFWIGKRIWSPSAYISLLNAGKSEGRNRFLMLFIIMTVAIGIFNVNAAGAINKILEKQIRYTAGADLVLVGEQKVRDDGRPEIDDTLLKEISSLDGIKQATKVLYSSLGTIRVKLPRPPGFSEQGLINLYGINPKEFGEIAFMPEELLPFHFNNYLNLLASDPSAMLVSSNIGRKYNLKPGDKINVKWGSTDNIYVEGYVAALIDYWPAFIPKDMEQPILYTTFIVANIDHLDRSKLTWPYEVWAKRSGEGSGEAIYKGIEEKKLKFTKLVDANQQLVKAKNEAILQGTNGSLTLGFIITMLVTGIGFLIYWMSSIKSRTLQFGIFRAMGMRLSKLLGIILYEQILISGTAILAGIIIGRQSSRLFIPIIQATSNPYNQNIPLRAEQGIGDYASLIVFLFLIMLIGFVILGRYISGMSMDQAIKLGED